MLFDAQRLNIRLLLELGVQQKEALMTCALITHPYCQKHSMGSHHPESPERLVSIMSHLQKCPEWRQLTLIQAEKASLEHLLLAHSKDYVEFVFAQKTLNNDLIYLDPDTAMNPFSLEAACLAAGSVIAGVDLVMQQQHQHVFCAVRPPGHHAEYNRAMGFCIFNNIAIGAQYALTHYSLERIAIVDFDVHHGNGTENIIASDKRILLCSTFQHPFYPYSGADSKNDHIVNIPLRVGCDSEHYRKKFSETVMPALLKFQPQLIFISAGFDAHYQDPLGGLQLQVDDYSWITEQLVILAKQCAENRIVSTLEGGYHLQALSLCVQAHIGALI